MNNYLSELYPQFYQPKSPLPGKGFIWAVLAIVIVLVVIGLARADTLGTASWYSRASCQKEGTSGIMANGKALNDEELICASWDYPFKTLLKVTNLANGKTVIVSVQDRGPAKRLYRKGRIIDLSRAAFLQLSSLRKGIIEVKIERLNQCLNE